MSYKLTRIPGIIRRLIDSADIPSDPANFDWQIYQVWLAAGNTPQSPDPLPTPDQLAATASDSIDRLQFDVMFSVENNVRALRALINTLLPGSFTAAQAAQITRVQYRDALIARWKVLNP